MESLLIYTCQNALVAHWIIFGLLMLAGLNFPLSEDILVITAGYIAGQCPSHSVVSFYLLIYVGCWVSAWEAYWLGRLLGPKLYHLPWFKRFITPEKMQKLNTYYEKFGIWTFIVGRFIPGGIRNALFMSSGLVKMPFHTFMIRDSISCLLSSSVLFVIGYSFAQNLELLLSYAKTYHLVLLLLIVVASLTTTCVILIKKRMKSTV